MLDFAACVSFCCVLNMFESICHMHSMACSSSVAFFVGRCVNACVNSFVAVISNSVGVIIVRLWLFIIHVIQDDLIAPVVQQHWCFLKDFVGI